MQYSLLSYFSRKGPHVSFWCVEDFGDTFSSIVLIFLASDFKARGLEIEMEEGWKSRGLIEG